VFAGAGLQLGSRNIRASAGMGGGRKLGRVGWCLVLVTGAAAALLAAGMASATSATHDGGPLLTPAATALRQMRSAGMLIGRATLGQLG
jgi:hypothetical protein